ncbi:hypothetical protein [Streptomyces sp. NPDC057854]|uniref:hypothetical protein n=1 Tax=unclassified Streptomyces TaxID=2593676 RepID=UPI00367FDDD8
MIKGQGQLYLPGARGWFKVRRRHTTEARPQILVLGQYDDHGALRPIGRTVPLSPDAARQVAGHLRPAPSGHLWAGVRFSSSWGSRRPLEVVLVAPDLVAEVDADTAIDRGRFVRPRLDVAVDDVPRFGEGTVAG